MTRVDAVTVGNINEAWIEVLTSSRVAGRTHNGNRILRDHVKVAKREGCKRRIGLGRLAEVLVEPIIQAGPDW